MKCLGNNSYLSELFLAGNCNFHCKTHSKIAEPCRTWVVKCFYSLVRPRFPMLTINQILGPHSVQSETTLWWRTLVLDRKKSRGKKEKESFYYIYTYYYIYIFLRSNRWHVLLSKFSQCRWPLGLELYSASPLADVSYFLCFTNVFLTARLRWYSSHTRRQAFSCCISYGSRTGLSCHMRCSCKTFNFIPKKV